LQISFFRSLWLCKGGADGGSYCSALETWWHGRATCWNQYRQVTPKNQHKSYHMQT
jgi:hypothetical protein